MSESSKPMDRGLNFEAVAPHLVTDTRDLLQILQPGDHSIRDHRAIRGFSVDSRTIGEGEVFVAIPGARVDGHRFVGQALSRGAAAVLVSNPESVGDEQACIRVGDTVKALGKLATAHRRALKTRFIGLTGSVGKTTTKDMIHAILSSTWRVRKSEGNFNNTIGLPIQILRCTDQDIWMVAEMGMSTPGEIAKLMHMAQPEIGLWLSVHAVHQANFADLDGIARAKAELVQNLDPRKTLVYNLDNPHVHRYAKDFPGKKITYGMLHPDAGIQARPTSLPTWDETRFQLLLPRDARLSLRLHLPGAFNIGNALAACATALAAGFPQSELHNGLRHLQTGTGRCRLHHLDGEIYLVDDTYNASPHAVGQVLRAFAALAAKHYRWLILGDMLELGKEELTIHRRLGRELASYGFDRITLVGPLSDATRKGLTEAASRRRNVRNLKVEHFADADEAISRMDPYAPEGARIWCKASRGIALEKVARFLLESFAHQKDH